MRGGTSSDNQGASALEHPRTDTLPRGNLSRSYHFHPPPSPVALVPVIIAFQSSISSATRPLSSFFKSIKSSRSLRADDAFSVAVPLPWRLTAAGSASPSTVLTFASCMGWASLSPSLFNHGAEATGPKVTRPTGKRPDSPD
ncbi:hypothetical protein WMY93_032008 [Mugilogobius chulae]|uniref:Uncharacterized protein n=1 Tax=Mugilogobius chulae TaxID=88201 RepID=A0AAW0ML61_9GOBI